MSAYNKWTVVHLVEGETFVAHFFYKDSAMRWVNRLRKLGATSEGSGLALYKDAARNGEPVQTWGAFPPDTDW